MSTPLAGTKQGAAARRAARGLAALWDGLENPVLGREFRSRMRGARSYLITGGYTLAVITFVLIAYGMLSSAADGAPANVVASRLGRGIWTWGCIAQALLVPLLVPAFTCGAITLERERDLLELLLLTRQSALQICLGKWGSGVGLGLMLVLASVPVLSLSLVLGGIAPEEILACLLVLCSAVLAVGAFGLALSTLAQKTVTSTVLTYSGIGLVLLGLPVLGKLTSDISALQYSGSEFGILAMLFVCALTAFAPGAALAGAVYALRRRRTLEPPTRTWWILSVGLCWAAVLALFYLPGMNEVLLQGDLLLMLHPVVVVHSVMNAEGWRPVGGMLWAVSALIYLGITAWCLFIAVTRVKRLRVN